jgi:hypothetical protein
LIDPYFPMPGGDQCPHALRTPLPVPSVPHGFDMSYPAIQKVLCEITVVHQFALLCMTGAIPDEMSPMDFRRRLEKQLLAP